MLLSTPVVAAPPNLATWVAWLGQIQQDVLNLGENRRWFREVMRIYNLNPHLAGNGYFFEMLAQNYATTMAVGIRRQADTRSDVVSMARLLKDLQPNAASVTRAWFAAQYASSPLGSGVGTKDFDIFAPGGGPHLDPAIVQNDFDELQRLAQPLKQFVNKRIAHADPKGAQVHATYGQLDSALDQFRQLLQRYFSLFHQGILDPDVVVQMPWTEIFRTVPWRIT